MAASGGAEATHAYTLALAIFIQQTRDETMHVSRDTEIIEFPRCISLNDSESRRKLANLSS